MRIVLLISVLSFLPGSCTHQKKTSLPYLGTPDVTGKDTIYPTIPDFSFIDQDSNVVTNRTFENKIYVADFIFLSCPTICPVMTREMVSVYNAYKTNPHLMFLSHTIDPARDTVGALKNYTMALGIDSRKWRFVTGQQDRIYSIAEENYYTAAYADSTAPGGFIHSGGLLLIDKDRHIRGVYDGTNQQETQRLLNDIEILLKEQLK